MAPVGSQLEREEREERELRWQPKERHQPEDETLAQLKARLDVPLLPMLIPVAPSGGPAKRRTTGFLKTNPVAEAALEALTLPEIGRRWPMPRPTSRLGAHTERPVRAAKSSPKQHACTERSEPVASLEKPKPLDYIERAGSPLDQRVAQLEERGFHLLAARLKEEQAATEEAEGQEAELMTQSLQDFYEHMKTFWSRESEAEMVNHLEKRGPRRVAQKLNGQQQHQLAAQKRELKMHHKRVNDAKPVVDVASPPQYQHHKVNRKKLQMQKEQQQELIRQNKILRRRVAESRRPAAGSSSTVAFTPRPPKKRAKNLAPRQPAEAPSRLRGSKQLSMTAKANPDNMRNKCDVVATAQVQVNQQEQAKEQSSQAVSVDAAMMGLGPETKSWMKKMKHACGNGDLSLLNRALKHVDVNTRIGGGWPPLSLAAAGGHADVVRELLKHGADPNGGLTSALELSSSSGHVECVEALVAFSTIQSASAACEKAALAGHLGAVRILLNYNGELLFDLTQKALQQLCDATEQHELEFGKVRPKLRVWYNRLRARLDSFDTLEAAVEAGDAEAVRHVLHSRDWRPRELDRCFANGWTPLGSAAVGGHVDVIQLLLQAGATLESQMSDGCDAIAVATQAKMEEALAVLLHWQNENRDASEAQARSQLKTLAARGVNKQREKSALIDQPRARADDPDELPWYQQHGGRPPGTEHSDPVRAAAEAVSIRAMRHGKYKKKSTVPPPQELKFPHGACSGLVSALSAKRAYEEHLSSRGLDPKSSVAILEGVAPGGGAHGGGHGAAQQQHQDESENVPLKPGMRKWKVGDRVV